MRASSEKRRSSSSGRNYHHHNEIVKQRLGDEYRASPGIAYPREIVGNNFVAAQVEDVFGTNQLMPESLPLNTSCDESRIENDRLGQDGLGLYTPEIISDDCSSVFLVVNYKM